MVWTDGNKNGSIIQMILNDFTSETTEFILKTERKDKALSFYLIMDEHKCEFSFCLNILHNPNITGQAKGAFVRRAIYRIRVFAM